MFISKKHLYLLAVFFLLAQYGLWNGIGSTWQGTREIKPKLEVVPDVPSTEIIKGFSFGDEQLTFRYYGYMMQFLGDTFGRVTPLKDYNYEKLYRWWSLLDAIDPKSDLIVYVVSYYYGSSQNKERDLPYVIKFIEEHSDKNPEDNWWWYAQAAYIARHDLEDFDTGIRIARKLENLPKDMDIPIWTRQLRLFLMEKQGEYKEACNIIVNLIKDYSDKKLTDGEMNFIHYFIQERLRTMIENESSISRADISPECRSLIRAQKSADLKTTLGNNAK